MGLHIESPVPARPPRLFDIALAAVARTCPRCEEAIEAPELRLLHQVASRVAQEGRSLEWAVEEAFRHSDPEDSSLVWLRTALRLSTIEVLAVALAAAVEDQPLVGRLLAHVQAPVGGSRPTLGLLSQAFSAAFRFRAALPAALLNGAGAHSGLLTVLNDSAPLPERPVAVPTALCLALSGHDAPWPGATIGLEEKARVPLPDSVLDRAREHARALAAADHRALVLRTGSPAEGRSAALVVAAALNTRPVFLESENVTGLGPWLLLRLLTPVFCFDLGPGDRRKLPPLPGYTGPVLAVAGPDGSVEVPQGAAASWVLQAPSQSERRALWLAALGGRPQDSAESAPEEARTLAGWLAADHRHGAGRIAHLGRLGHHYAALAGRDAPARSDIVAAAWTGEGSGLDSLAEPLRAAVPDEALVMPDTLRARLDALLLRCRARDDLVEGLGASATTRYRPGVRALFTGPSGTGKTLAAGWIATRLGLPLYRVDLASVTSKYIGETEKNLSQLLARAEQAEVILLFDEADSLFGKRTEIGDANDRFANAQTNYLLQRIENYDGIVLLTSNSQARFDEAFARRLDFTIEFPLPGPEERRALWQSHLGPHSSVPAAELNRLAVLLDLNGGHIRNAVLAAAVRARNERRSIAFADLLAGITAELGKLGRQVPLELRRRV